MINDGKAIGEWKWYYKTEIRDFAHQYFQKTFDFLQLKDPLTYHKVVHLETELTQQEEFAFWEIIRENQEKISKEQKAH